MINIEAEIVDGRVLCGNKLCRREIGKMRLDNVHVLLFSYRFGKLVHAASVSENDDRGTNSVTINRFIDNIDANLMPSVPSLTADNGTGALNMEFDASQSDTLNDFSTIFSTLDELNLSRASTPTSDFLNQIVKNAMSTENNECDFSDVPLLCNGSLFDLLEEGDFCNALLQKFDF